MHIPRNVAFLKTLSKKDKKHILKSFEITYADLCLLNEVNNERLFVVDIQSRFVLYHALHIKYHPDSSKLTSKFLLSYLKVSFQTSQKILSNLVELGFLTKQLDNDDKRRYNYSITTLGEKSVLLWESFKANDYNSVKRIDFHSYGLLDMTEKRMAKLREEFLEN
ncbi:MAG: helix-turn-helix domain-containing protein [Proteobacteria bacterium]|nr:helix-turn-helix domain-containing protein [Pseudomonadota bacterium]